MSDESWRTVPPAPVQIPAEPPKNPDGERPDWEAEHSCGQVPQPNAVTCKCVDYAAPKPAAAGEQKLSDKPGTVPPRSEVYASLKANSGALQHKAPSQPAAAVEGKITMRPTEFYYRRAMERSAEIKRDADVWKKAEVTVGFMTEEKPTSPTPAVPAESGEAKLKWVSMLRVTESGGEDWVVTSATSNATRAEAEAAAAAINKTI